MSTTSLFQPAVTVSDDGTINIDWFDCYINTVDDDDEGGGEPRYNEADGFPHSTLLDSIIEGSKDDPAGALRRLADYIDSRKEG